MQKYTFLEMKKNIRKTWLFVGSKTSKLTQAKNCLKICLRALIKVINFLSFSKNSGPKLNCTYNIGMEGRCAGSDKKRPSIYPKIGYINHRYVMVFNLGLKVVYDHKSKSYEKFQLSLQKSETHILVGKLLNILLVTKDLSLRSK